MLRCILIIILYLIAEHALLGQLTFGQAIADAKSISEDPYEQITALKDILKKKKYSSHPDSLGLVHYAIAYRYRNEADDINTISHARDGIRLFQQADYSGYQLPFLYSFLGESFTQLDAQDSALYYYQQILDEAPVGRALTVYGYAAFNASEIYRQSEDYQTALDFIQYVTQGKYAAELSQYDLMDLYLNASICFSNLDIPDAIEQAQTSLDKAKEIVISIDDLDPLQELEIESQQAYIYLNSGQKEKAAAIFKNSLQLITSYAQEDEYTNAEAAAMAGNISYTYQQTGDYNQGVSYARQAQAIYDNYGDDRFTETEYLIYSNLATSMAGLQSLDSAQYYAGQALYTLTSSNSYQGNLKRLSLQALYDKANVLISQADLSQQRKPLDEALQILYQLDSLLDDQIEDQLSNYSVRNIKSRATQYYQTAIDLAVRLEKKEDYWYFSEKTKGLQLLEANIANQQQGKSSADLSLGEVKRSILQLNYLIDRTDDVQIRDSLIITLADYKKQRIDLTQQLKSSRQLSIDINDLPSIQANLQDEVILQYQAGETQLYGLRITKDRTQLITIGDLQKINHDVRSLRRLIQHPDSNMDSIIGHATQLYDQLISPFQSAAEHLVIIPDEGLHFLPFDILTDSEGNYLIQRASISYAISGSFYNIHYQDRKRFRSIHFLQPDYNNEGIFAPLPFADQEKTAIKDVYQLAKNIKVYSKSAIDSIFEQAGIFHYSGHAIANMGTGEEAYLALGNEDRLEDKLLLGELYTMSTPAQMVVLSACNTGIGQIIKSEGVESLTRGFLYAGASSVISTLWTVDDQSTATIIGGFYESLAQGTSKHEALRAAKLRYLSNTETYLRHPYYWAGIVPVGDMSPLDPYRINWLKHLYILLAFIGIGWFLTWRYNKKPFPKIEFLEDQF